MREVKNKNPYKNILLDLVNMKKEILAYEEELESLKIYEYVDFESDSFQRSYETYLLISEKIIEIEKDIMKSLKLLTEVM